MNPGFSRLVRRWKNMATSLEQRNIAHDQHLWDRILQQS
jgi:hypothetical protein